VKAQGRETLGCLPRHLLGGNRLEEGAERSQGRPKRRKGEAGTHFRLGKG